jgi:hypothetical protein
MCYENRTARLDKLKLRSFEGFADWTRKPTVLEGNLRRLKTQRRNPTLKIFHVCIYFLNQPAFYDFGYVERHLFDFCQFICLCQLRCNRNGSSILPLFVQN